MTKQSFSITPQQILAGQAVYSKLVLSFYDWTVIHISNNFIWKCPSSRIQALYQEHVSNNHLEVGVGTGFFLQHCRFNTPPRIALMDLNQNCLDVTAKRLAVYKPEQYKVNIYDPIKLPKASFDSLGFNYVLHCLPGNIHQKAIVLNNLKPLLNPKAVIFGSTILGKGITFNPLAQKMIDAYNAKGVFTNLQDDFEGLKEILDKNFSSCHLELIGCVALFWATI